MDSDLERGSVSQPSLPETQPAASLAEAEAAFRRAHPRYDDTTVLDELRRSNFTRLDTGGHVYLDYTGAGLYADSQLSEHLELLRASVFGNPHSVNPTSSAMTELVERAREAVLRFFRASPDEYLAIFPPNATGALRLVGEAYPFHPGDRFLLTFDNHNSVNGIREFARARGAETTYVPSEAPNLRVDEELLPRYLTEVGGQQLLGQIGIETIHARVEMLAISLLDALGSLRHANGAPAATIYGPRDFERRGATIAFNFLHPASATPAPVRSPSRSRAKRSSAASSAMQ